MRPPEPGAAVFRPCPLDVTLSVMNDRGHLLTEQPNPHSADLDALPLEQAFDVMNAEDRRVAEAVAAAKDAIVAAVRIVSDGLRQGGRLIYVGAGTSGRLGVLDAAECPPTFLTDPQTVQGIIAGGDAALKKSAEHREDDPDYGAAEIDRVNAGPADTILGIATGGTTPFVHGALRRARERGARTVFLACVPQTEVPDQADVSIRVLTGPEVVSGSTRLKAGLATKMVLNMISTLAMVQLGKVYGNLMVDLTPVNKKLVERSRRLVRQATGCDLAAADLAYAESGGKPKVAILMILLGMDASAAANLLEKGQGRIAEALKLARP